MEARITRRGELTTMTMVLDDSPCVVRQRPRVLSERKIEHMLDWAEPIIRRCCRQVWQEVWPRGLELDDLFQEGRIAVFLAAEKISTCRRPHALVAAIVKRQAYDAIRMLADRGPHYCPRRLRALEETADP